MKARFPSLQPIFSFETFAYIILHCEEQTYILPSEPFSFQTIMFGLIISGRPVNAEPAAISQTQYAFSIPSTPPFSHLTLFLLPGMSLPPDVAVSVWIKLPPSQDFKLLGGLSIQKQSAIFKISGIGNTGAQGGVAGADDAMIDEGSAATPATAVPTEEIVLGLSIEPAAAVEQQLATLLPARSANAQTNPTSSLVRQPPPTVPMNQVTAKVLAQRIIGNAFNFLTSFGDGQSVPIKAFQDWWNKFEKKIDLDPSFLLKEDAQG